MTKENHGETMENYAEKELVPLGYKVVKQDSRHATFCLEGISIEVHVNLSCTCPAYPNIHALGCPLHHVGPGGSWSIEDAKRIAKTFHGSRIKAVS